MSPFCRLKVEDVNKAAKRSWVDMGRRILGTEQHVLFPLQSQSASSPAHSRAHGVAGSTQLMLLVNLTGAVSGKSAEQREKCRDWLKALVHKLLSPSKWSVTLSVDGFDFVFDLNDEGKLDMREMLGSQAWRQSLGSKKSPFHKKYKQDAQELCDILMCLRLHDRHHDLLRQMLIAMAVGIECSLDFLPQTFLADEEADEELGLGFLRDMAMRVRNIRFVRKKKTAAPSENMTAGQKARLRSKRCKIKNLITSQDRHRERALYWQASRKHLQTARRLAVAFDASRVGGRKRTTYILCHLTSGQTAWGPPQASCYRRHAQ